MEKTMHEEYGEPNDKLGKHIVCQICGSCKNCSDCECDKEITTNYSKEELKRVMDKELKTLKDIEFLDKEVPYLFCWSEDLKKEAIKRVNACVKNVTTTTELRCYQMKKISSKCDGCKRDLWIHNLTEEDLKDE